MLTLYKTPKAPADRHDRFIVKWSGYPIGVIYETDCLQLPYRYSWAKNSQFGPCTSGIAVTLDDAKEQFEKNWLNCLDSIGLEVKPPNRSPESI